MKKVLLTAAVMVSLNAASFAMAGGAEQKPVSQQAPRGGLYVGVGAGWGALDVPLDSTVGLSGAVSSSQKTNGFSGRVNVGYLAGVSQNMSLGGEAGYTYLPYTTNTVTMTSEDLTQTFSRKYDPRYVLDLLAVAKFYVTSELNVFGKAGIAYVNQKQTVSTEGFYSSSTDGKVLPELAVGAGYNIAQNLEANLTYAHAFGDNHESQIVASTTDYMPSFNTVMAGLNYTFNM